jgi:hypothetical protein
MDEDHTHIIINHDAGLHLVIHSNVDELDLPSVINRMIIEKLCNAETGV